MIIDGKEINFFQDRNDVSKRYYEIISQSIREGLNKISAVQQVKSSVSKTTDSFYFEVKMKYLNKIITISLRTHSPKERKTNYVYLYIPNYKEVSSLVESTQLNLVNHYNRLAEENNFPPIKAPNKNQEIIKQPRKKEIKRKLRGTKIELLDVQTNSFQSFLDEFNK
ncbi:hypothetical protein [Vagococcus jeotgali]|uniref:hypothetical protein n=1 Tax=Vagococcus jeotgali TaxID=3109030 RepID=UPI002DDC85E0|nr:hypothetical protein [Vagococcus sp. B2T-5]